MAQVVRLVALLLAAGPGERPRVRLDVDGCDAVPREEVRRLLAIELHADLDDGSEPAFLTTRVRVSCAGTLATLHVEDPVTQKSLRRNIDLGPLALKAQPRLVAIAAAELVAASWAEAENSPQPKVLPAGPQPSPDARASVRAAVEARASALDTPLRLMGFLGARGTPSAALYGGVLALRYDCGEWWGVAVDVAGLYGSAGSPLGTVAQYNASGSAFAYARWAGARLSARVGVGVRGGPVWLTGQPFAPAQVAGSTLLAFWGGPLLEAGLSVPVGRGLSLEALAEVGYVTRPVSALADGNTAMSVDGPWGGISVGLGWGL